MLLAADRNDHDLRAAASPAPAAPIGEPTRLVEISRRYGEQRKVNFPALIVACVIQALVAIALVQTGISATRKPTSRLVVMNLSPPPPPPPPAAKTPPPPPQTQIVAPAPVLQLPRPTPPLIVPVAPPASPVTVAVATPPAPPAPPAPPSVVKADDLGARMISGVPPRYPMECRRKHEQGTVVLELTLNVDGGVATISIAQSSGSSRLDDAALQAVRKWRWAPTLRDGKPVMVRGEVEIPFVLQG